MLLEALDLAAEVGERVLFQGITLAVFPGDVVVITGPSGAGKSTLLKILSGETEPSRGRVTRFCLQGEIPQDLALNEELTAADNARIGRFKGLSLWASLSLWFRGDPGIREKLGRWGLHKPLQRLGTMSGGEKQRVAVARALDEDWRVLFADEPISQLDDQNARLVLGTLREEARRREGALVLVLHHKALAEEFGTRELKLGLRP